MWCSTCWRRWSSVDASRPASRPALIQSAAAVATVTLAASAVWTPAFTSTRAVAAKSTAAFRVVNVLNLPSARPGPGSRRARRTSPRPSPWSIRAYGRSFVPSSSTGRCPSRSFRRLWNCPASAASCASTASRVGRGCCLIMLRITSNMARLVDQRVGHPLSYGHARADRACPPRTCPAHGRRRLSRYAQSLRRLSGKASSSANDALSRYSTSWASDRPLDAAAASSLSLVSAVVRMFSGWRFPPVAVNVTSSSWPPVS